MEIQLRRTHSPEEMVEEPCGLCEVGFDVGSVLAQVVYSGAPEGPACPDCLEHFHRRNPERFPGPEELEVAQLRHPEPIFGSVGEILQLERRDLDAAMECYAGAWLARA